jgi:nucleoside-diphosphate-sugar epimerase
VTRVLVTGATGYIGPHAVAALERRGFEVVAVGSRQADLLAPEGPERAVAVARADTLLHLAWYAEHGRFWTAPENLDWVGASLRLLRAFAAAGGRRVVMAGSCAEYGWDGLDGPCVEGVTPLAPATLYGAAKHATHVAAEAFARQEGLSFAWGRVFFSFGPGEAPGRLVAAVARGLLAGEDVPVSEGSQVRDFIAVEELGEAFAALVSSDVVGPVNVASGQGVAVRDLVALVARETGREDLVRPGALPSRPDDPPYLVADAGRLAREAGWRAHEPLADGVARAVAWWRKAAPGGTRGSR